MIKCNIDGLSKTILVNYKCGVIYRSHREFFRRLCNLHWYCKCFSCRYLCHYSCDWKNFLKRLEKSLAWVWLWASIVSFPKSLDGYLDSYAQMQEMHYQIHDILGLTCFSKKKFLCGYTSLDLRY